ncbi:kinesin-like protein KIN-UB isoform X1 [Salvia splendens]|uniref:kinesin-like protein KIN-UB isoform X1 n=1 Tax=Salvia splendens TaxID=180675 RepID=UPI001C25A52C|nr:kinesin-like protein KIN-UB isoform X1 [Salvia splendens]
MREAMQMDTTSGNPPVGQDSNHMWSRDGNNGERVLIANLHEQVGLQKILSLLESEDATVRKYEVKVVANLAAEGISHLLLYASSELSNVFLIS